MDCMCCADGGIGPTTDKEFLGSICHLYTSDGETAKFPVERDRYILYVAAGCPFAARPWLVQSIYGLPIQIVKVFPATETDGWFFEPKSEGELKLVENVPDASVDVDPYRNHHLSQLYKVANANFEGVVSVPLLWDKVNNTAVSNSSLGLAEMLSVQLKPHLATRNQHLELYPDSKSNETVAEEHSDLVKWIHSNVTTVVYKIARAGTGKKHDEMIHDYYTALGDLERRLIKNDESGTVKFLMGEQVRFADVLLWISLLRLDLCYQFRFGIGKLSVREDFPRLKQFCQQIFDIEGIKEAVIPRDIMSQYYMSAKWTDIRSLPMVPTSWEKAMGLNDSSGVSDPKRQNVEE